MGSGEGEGRKRPEMLPKPNGGYTGHTCIVCVCGKMARMGQAKTETAVTQVPSATSPGTDTCVPS